MPCAKINLNIDITQYSSKRVNNTIVKYCGNTLIIPIVTVSTRLPFNPKGIVIANIIVFSDKFKKINKKKMFKIIEKFNKLFNFGYVCKNNKKELIIPLIEEVELFMKFINIKMNWDDDILTDNIYFNKDKNWYNY